MKKNIRKMIEAAEKLDWRVDKTDDGFFFQKYSPHGQDFSITVTATTLDEVIKEIDFQCKNFDCSEAAYNWLDNFGHGKNGAPHDMKDVYEDMEACLKMMEKLCDTLKFIY